jgi:hypothetical protein
VAPVFFAFVINFPPTRCAMVVFIHCYLFRIYVLLYCLFYAFLHFIFLPILLSVCHFCLSSLFLPFPCFSPHFISPPQSLFIYSESFNTYSGLTLFLSFNFLILHFSIHFILFLPSFSHSLPSFPFFIPPFCFTFFLLFARLPFLFQLPF